MKSNSMVTLPQSEKSPSDSRGARNYKYSYSAQVSAMETLHGLPGSDLDPPFIRSTIYSSRNNRNNPAHPKLYQQDPQLEWYQTHPMAYPYFRLEERYELLLQDDLLMGQQNNNLDYAYNWPRSSWTEISIPTGAVPGFDSGYLVHPFQHNYVSELIDPNRPNDMAVSPAALDQLSLTSSPEVIDQPTSENHMNSRSTPGLMDVSSKASDNTDGGTAGDCRDGYPAATENLMPEAPYAKLIYKALMEAPNHSMVLQDIYQWFIDNTGKGKSASTGWRNSIRHNLSMNAAFRKTSRKSNGEESKKISEWVLEPFAIMEGITPTTRYRKNSKKSHKSAGSVPTYARSNRLPRNSSRKGRIQTHQPSMLCQGTIHGLQQNTLTQPCTSATTDQYNLSPCNPNHHQPMTDSLWQPGLSTLNNLGQYADVTPSQNDREEPGYSEEHGPYRNNDACSWANSPYYLP